MSEISKTGLIYQNIFHIYVYHKIFIYLYIKNVKSNILYHRGNVAAILISWFLVSVLHILNTFLNSNFLNYYKQIQKRHIILLNALFGALWFTTYDIVLNRYYLDTIFSIADLNIGTQNIRTHKIQAVK